VDKEFSGCHQQHWTGYGRGMVTTARVACSGSGPGHWGWSKDLDHVQVRSRKQKRFNYRTPIVQDLSKE
jgi:hypothetical protein